MNLFIVDFENDVALEGIPYLKLKFPFIEVTGLLARNVHDSVYSSYPELPIFEKKIELQSLLDRKSECQIDVDLIQFLMPYEEHIYYNINRYFDTGLAFDYTLIRYKLITYVLEMFKNSPKTEFVYFGVTPHDPVSYLVYIIAKFLGVVVLLIDKAHWLNGYVLYQEIGMRASSVLAAPTKTNQKMIEADIEIIQSSLQSLVKEKPNYMGVQHRQFGSLYKKIWTSVVVKKRLSFAGYTRYREKQIEKAGYSGLASIRDEQDLIRQTDYLIFFPLHFQPELTTSPDGGLYAQQWLAVKHLVERLPSGFKILVKEHPSQFLINSKSVRSKHLYDGILSISEKIEFVDLNLDSKKILQYSSGAMTITGTIGLEALLKEKPVLYFGDAIFGGIKGAYGPDAIEDFLNHILEQKSLKQADVLDQFNAFGRSVFFTGISPEIKHPASHFKATEILFKEFLRSL